MNAMNINCKSVTLNLAAGVSNNVELSELAGYITIYNDSNYKVFVRSGETSDLVASNIYTAIAPGAIMSYSKFPEHDYIAGFCEDGTAVLHIQYGNGI